MAHPTIEQAVSIVETLLGRCPRRIEAFHPAVGGDDSHAFRLWLGNDAMLLKIKKHAGSPIGVYLHRRMRGADVPVPELIAFDATAGPCRQACAVWGWVNGMPVVWEPDAPPPYDEAELGEILRRIHELTFDGDFGFLGDDPSERAFTYTPYLAPTSESWEGMFRCAAAARTYFDKGYIDQRQADTLSSLPERLADDLGQAERRLLHMGDIMFNGNLIVEPHTRRILAVVDYVESMAGDPRLELACFDYYFRQMPLRRELFDMDRFRAAYGTNHDPQDRLGRFYLAAILVFEKLLFFDPASARGRWAIGTVRGILNGFEGEIYVPRATKHGRRSTSTELRGSVLFHTLDFRQKEESRIASWVD